MLYNGQTVRHKKTDELVKVVGQPDDMWVWEVDHLVTENGTRITDCDNVLKDYTHIENEWGEGVPGDLSLSGPDVSLKKYIGMSEDEKKQLRDQQIETNFQSLVDKLCDPATEHAVIPGRRECWHTTRDKLLQNSTVVVQVRLCLTHSAHRPGIVIEFENRQWWIYEHDLYRVKQVEEI